jgi:hypothetical protein
LITGPAVRPRRRRLVVGRWGASGRKAPLDSTPRHSDSASDVVEEEEDGIIAGRRAACAHLLGDVQYSFTRTWQRTECAVQWPSSEPKPWRRSEKRRAALPDIEHWP